MVETIIILAGLIAAASIAIKGMRHDAQKRQFREEASRREEAERAEQYAEKKRDFTRFAVKQDRWQFLLEEGAADAFVFEHADEVLQQWTADLDEYERWRADSDYERLTEECRAERMDEICRRRQEVYGKAAGQRKEERYRYEAEGRFRMEEYFQRRKNDPSGPADTR